MQSYLTIQQRLVDVQKLCYEHDDVIVSKWVFNRHKVTTRDSVRCFDFARSYKERDQNQEPLSFRLYFFLDIYLHLRHLHCIPCSGDFFL